MDVNISVSEIGFDKNILIHDNIYVHSIVYKILDYAQQEGIQRASDIYLDLASYGLYYQKTNHKSLQELPKNQIIKINNFKTNQQFFILHRGKKATQNRRRDEETYRIQYETSKNKNKQEIKRIDKINEKTKRPKRKSTINQLKNPPKRKKTTRKSTIHSKDSIVLAINQVDEINKIKKKLQVVKKKRIRSIYSRKQKLSSIQVGDILSDITLKYIIRSHSKGESNYKNDYTTPVYCVNILPQITDNSSSNTIFCTGGAHKICFSDYKTGKVVKIFQDNPLESFYCISSSFISKFIPLKNGKEEDSIIIAAAGKQSDIKLINYKRNECYNILKGHTGNINELQFSPKTSYYLLSASSDESIILWDIREGGKQLIKFNAKMEIYSMDIACDGSYFIVGGRSFKDRSYGFDLFPLQTTSIETNKVKKTPLLRERRPSTSSLVSIDCIKLINHSTLVAKPHPGNEIIGYSFFYEPGRRIMRCVEIFRLQNQHSISQSVHKFCLTSDKKELLVCDKDGGISIFDIPNEYHDNSTPISPKMIGYHPQCIDYGLQIIISEKKEGKQYIISTGSMNYIYIWERNDIDNNEMMDVEIFSSNSQQETFIPFPPVYGWGYQQQPIKHEDFTQLSNSVIIFDSDEEEINEDEIIVYQQPIEQNTYSIIPPKQINYQYNTQPTCIIEDEIMEDEESDNDEILIYNN